MNQQDILRTVLAEHDGEQATGSTLEALTADVEARLAGTAEIPAYTESSEQLSVVTFRCMLQDTGYPMEVYMPAGEDAAGGAVDMSKLRERWVGWAVEVPGEQSWARPQSQEISNGAESSKCRLPKEVHGKYPLAGNGGAYLGTLVKVYDEEVTFKPASVHTFTGILSTASLPSAMSTGEDEAAEVIVPTVHVLRVEPEPDHTTASADVAGIPDGLIDYLSTAFSPPDRLAAELVLLSLLSSPAARPNALPPLGTLSLNLLRKDFSSTEKVESIVASIAPRVISQPLSLPLLHSHPFSPSSTDASLESGLLQLASGTVLLVREDEMGQGGQLQEKAVKNLRALMECARDQTVRYEYPFMDGLKMECNIKVIMLSEGKSLVPVDINLPLLTDAGTSASAPTSTTSEVKPDLEAFRGYLASRSSSAHAAKFNIPDDVAQAIQDDFVSRRKDSNTAEEGLKRRMRLARLMAISTASGTLSREVWKQTLDLDSRIEARIPAPTPAAPAAQ